MQRFRLNIAYDGTDFHGWQKQTRPSDADPSVHVALRTVQAEVEQAVRDVVREPILLQGASRTDAGVHALAQTAAFTVGAETIEQPEPGAETAREPVWRRLTCDRLRQAINSRLPGDVLVTTLAATRDDFDPIGDCLEKGYRYSLHVGRDRPLFDRRFVHHVRTELDASAMRDAAGRFVGRHDFAAFAAAGHGRLSTVRTVTSCAVSEEPGGRVRIDIAGEGFLHNMVRIIAGTLTEIGRGRLAPEAVDRALASGDRRDAGPTLPPTGLCLMWMRYADDGSASM